MKEQLSRSQLEKILQAQDIEKLSPEQIANLFLEDQEIAKFAPDGICQIDPRNGDRIVFNSARARRPYDNRPAEQNLSQQECLICKGKTTHVVDVAQLSEGFTFINKNLYPVFYPNNFDGESEDSAALNQNEAKGREIHGFHFLQWTSSYHDKDWHNMPQSDRVIVMKRLAVLEKKLLEDFGDYVMIIKNYGHLVGGSLVHGHQQIGNSNVIPNRFRQNKKFQKEYGETFSAYMLRENPSDLTIKDYGPAVLLTPYYMRRPYDMLLILKDTKKSYLHSLTEAEIAAATDGWQDAIRIMLTVMPQIGREIAYNITTHNGPGAGLYFEFLPYTQEMGGFEHLGIYLCQGNPQSAAEQARKSLTKYRES